MLAVGHGVKFNFFTHMRPSRAGAACGDTPARLDFQTRRTDLRWRWQEFRREIVIGSHGELVKMRAARHAYQAYDV
jgi:hypothetical protein